MLETVHVGSQSIGIYVTYSTHNARLLEERLPMGERWLLDRGI